MIRRTVLVAAALALVSGLASAQPPKLDGAWTAVSAERDGKPAEDVVGNRLTFAGDAFVIEREGKTIYRGTYKADANAKPARFDFTHTDGALKGKRWLGLYALEGDTLRTVDNAPDMAKPRPGAFAAGPGSGYVLIVFKRAAR